jgi:tetratricopeptide (TPR) repeat protein
VHCRLAELLQKSNKKQKAVAHYQATLQLHPTYFAAYPKLVQLLAELNRSDEAIRLAEKCIEKARSANQQAVVSQMTEWLEGYRAKLGPTTGASRQK